MGPDAWPLSAARSRSTPGWSLVLGALAVPDGVFDGLNTYLLPAWMIVFGVS